MPLVLSQPLPATLTPETSMVSLGLPGAWASDGEPADAFASCAGGSPCLPRDAAALLHRQQLSCVVCRQLPSLVIQVGPFKTSVLLPSLTARSAELLSHQ